MRYESALIAQADGLVSRQEFAGVSRSAVFVLAPNTVGARIYTQKRRQLLLQQAQGVSVHSNGVGRKLLNYPQHESQGGESTVCLPVV